MRTSTPSLPLLYLSTRHAQVLLSSGFTKVSCFEGPPGAAWTQKPVESWFMGHDARRFAALHCSRNWRFRPQCCVLARPARSGPTGGVGRITYIGPELGASLHRARALERLAPEVKEFSLNGIKPSDISVGGYSEAS